MSRDEHPAPNTLTDHLSPFWEDLQDFGCKAFDLYRASGGLAENAKVACQFCDRPGSIVFLYNDKHAWFLCAEHNERFLPE